MRIKEVDMGKAEDRRDALELMLKSRFVFVTSLDDRGYPETRAMFNLKRRNRSGRLPGIFLAEAERFSNILGTNTSSRKVAQVAADPRVCLYFADTRNFMGLSVKGRLVAVDDMGTKKALWQPSWTRYYPQGVADPDFTVLRFEQESGRYYHGLRVAEIEADR
jgi:general stress protein 26